MSENQKLQELVEAAAAVTNGARTAFTDQMGFTFKALKLARLAAEFAQCGELAELAEAEFALAA